MYKKIILEMIKQLISSVIFLVFVIFVKFKKFVISDFFSLKRFIFTPNIVFVILDFLTEGLQNE